MKNRPNQARPPKSGRVGFGEIADAVGRFWGRLSVPLLGAWLLTSLLLYLLVVFQGRAFPFALDPALDDLRIDSVREYLIFVLLAQAVSLVRLGLFLPARLLYEGNRPSTPTVWRLAATRMPTLLNLTIQTSAVFVAVGLACFLLDVTLTTWAVLPLAFALEPAKYYATAHQMTATSALRRALSVSRRHWLPIFTVFGAIVCISTALPTLVDAALTYAPAHSHPIAETTGRLSLHIGADFLAFLTSCGLYFALDDHEQRE